MSEVVGICGQGGRHPYFRIPLDVFESALDRILGTNLDVEIGPVDIDRVIEEIAAACQALRQQTYFDAATRCVNDKLPSMVPLLPPEAIWANGSELPLDVWRLLSFEFDLVSSSVSSQVPVEDFAFSAVSQSALAFRFLMKQLQDRRIQFSLKPKKIPPSWLSAFTTKPAIDVSLARLYFEAGCLLTPWAKDTPAQWYAAIRYLHWIDATSYSFRVKDEFDADSVDSRYRGIFAEESAIGMMAVVLSDVSGAIPINNTAEWIAASRPGSPKPSGPIADFIARAIDPVTLASTTLIAESKGSLGSAVSAKRMKRAEEQLDATKVIVGGTTAILPLAFCSSIRFSKEKPDSCCQVIDPPPNSDGDRIALDPMVGWRLAYAKALRFVGMEMAAKQVFHGETAETIRPMDFDHERERKRSNRDFERIRRAKLARDRFGMELLLDVGECAVSVDSTVALVLRHGIHEESASKLSEALLSRRSLANERKSKSSFETALGLGCVFYSDLDEHHEH